MYASIAICCESVVAWDWEADEAVSNDGAAMTDGESDERSTRMEAGTSLAAKARGLGLRELALTPPKGRHRNAAETPLRDDTGRTTPGQMM